MDLQWIGWAVSGAVGLGGLWVANSAGNRQKETALAVVAQQTETQLAIAREERRYQARLAAYTETLSVLKSTTEWEKQVNWWSYGDDSPADIRSMPGPPMESAEDRPLDLHWTPRVTELLWDWVATVNEVDRRGEAAWQLWREWVDSGQVEPEPRLFRSTEAHVDLVAATRRMFTAINAVRDQMIRELYEQDPGLAG